MAGIGFRLRALSERDTLLAPVASIGHAALIAAGPWLLTVTALGGISMSSNELSPAATIDGFRLVVIYAFCISLVLTAPVVLIAARLVGDAVYSREFERVQPLFVASSLTAAAVAGPASLLGYGVFLGVPAATTVAAASCTTIVAVIWVAMSFCGAVRDYKGITLGFLAGMSVAVGATVAVSHWTSGWEPMIWAFNGGLLVVLASLTSRVLATFPPGQVEISAAAVRLGDGMLRHPWLALAGLVGAVALWGDKWVMWFAPERIPHEIGLVHTPLYDSAMFTAYLAIVPALAMFVTHVETSFETGCRSYYAAIRGHATLGQIEQRADALKRTTFSALGRIVLVQAALCLVVVIAAPTIVEATGLLYQQVGILRLGAIAALCQFVFFAATSLLLFFGRHRRFLALQGCFLALQTGLTLATLELGPATYGYGNLAACVICAALALATLEHTMDDLSFITFVQSNANRPTRRIQDLDLGRLLPSWPRSTKKE